MRKALLLQFIKGNSPAIGLLNTYV